MAFPIKQQKDLAGLLDYRGGYDASGNTYPTTGGSGPAGAVMKGDMWIVNVAGTLGGEAIQVGDSIIASVNNPGQTASNWNHLNSNISYVPENVANKETSALDTSETKYPCNNVVKTALEAHTNLEVYTEAGAHGIRRYEDKLEYWNGTRWVEIKASPYKIYGVDIDLTNNNSLTSVTYTNDAIGMQAGSSNWDEIDLYKNIKPCVFKDGVLQYYLDPTDYTKKADGSASDIISGDDGDVMIEIPKMGYSIETEGDTLKIRLTDNPNDPNFKYYAHSRDAEGDRDNLYIGAYLGYYDGSSKLRSLSGKTPTASQTIGTFRTQAQANGTGYDQISFYPLTLLQCLYLIRYKSLDSQTALGRGYVDGNASATATGGANALGMYYGEATGQIQMKFAGIEDFWGNLYYWIDGLFSNATWNILTAFKNFNDTGSGYTDNGQGATANIEGYMSKPQGGNGTGFVLKEYGGSDSTFFCDYGYLYASHLPAFGGGWAPASSAGAFRLSVAYSASSSYSSIGGRLMYL